MLFKEQQELLTVAGHPRSGTTILMEILDSHPDIVLTREFRNFTYLGERYLKYVRYLRKDWFRSALVRVERKGIFENSKVASLRFLCLYLCLLSVRMPTRITIKDVRMVLGTLFPHVRLVGDKRPGYYYHLETIVPIEGMYCIVICRDPRDVAQSSFRMLQTSWRHTDMRSRINTVEKIATRWLEMFDKVAPYQDRLLLIRYEDLITSPQETLGQIGKYLNVAPEGFEHTLIRPTSIGKYRDRLTSDQISRIEDIAGERMQQYGYL